MVSIIIPAYNREKLIVETLDSVLSQTYTDWEALVVDDQSTDMTQKVVEDYSRKDNRIKLLIRVHEPKGAPACRNNGIKNAQGEYLIFLDSDDVLASHCLQSRVEYMNEHPELDFSVFPMGVINTEGKYQDVKLIKQSNNYLYSYLRHDLPWTMTGPIWRTSFLKINGLLFNENYPRLQDPEFNTRILLLDDVKFIVMSGYDVDCFYRNNSNKVFNILILLTGFDLYIREFSEKIKDRKDAQICKKQLRFSFIQVLQGFYYYYDEKYSTESLNQLKKLQLFTAKQGIVDFKLNVLSAVFILFYQLKLYKLPYGKYMKRFIMKLIKIL